ncbi:PHP domain-containing protein [Candidatus Micrarchaeota archaeon]|nr:PHP domain-containing protein [Candidatus Micrarchaeota archaeon]
MVVEFDLHCHSTRSDGTFTPEQLIFEAKRLGLKGLGIVDHDVLPSKELISLAHSSSIPVLCGIELHCDDCNDVLHILGYGVNEENEEIASILEIQAEREHSRLRGLVENLNSAGMKLDFENDVVWRAKGRSVNYLDVFDALFEKKHFNNFYALKDFLDAPDCKLMPSIVFPSSEAFIRAIHSQGGLAVLAHPLALNKETRKQKIKKAIKLGVNAVELNYPYVANGYSPSSFDDDDFAFLRELVKASGLLVSGGSDFHGSVKGRVRMGLAGIGVKEFSKIAGRLKL